MSLDPTAPKSSEQPAAPPPVQKIAPIFGKAGSSSAAVAAQQQSSGSNNVAQPAEPRRPHHQHHHGRKGGGHHHRRNKHHHGNNNHGHGPRHGHGHHRNHHKTAAQKEKEKEREERRKAAIEKREKEEAAKSLVYFQLVAEVGSKQSGREQVTFEGPEVNIEVLRELIAEKKKMLAVDVDILHKDDNQPYPNDINIPSKTFVWVKRRPTLKSRIQIIESEAASRDYKPTPQSPSSGEEEPSFQQDKQFLPEQWPAEFLCPRCEQPLENAVFQRCCRSIVCEKCGVEDPNGNCLLCKDMWEGAVPDIMMRGVLSSLRREWYYLAKDGPPPEELAMSPVDDDDEEPSQPKLPLEDQAEISPIEKDKSPMILQVGEFEENQPTADDPFHIPEPISTGGGNKSPPTRRPGEKATSENKATASTTSEQQPQQPQPKLSASAALAAKYAAEEAKKAERAKRKKLRAAKSDAQAAGALNGTAAGSQGPSPALSVSVLSGSSPPVQPLVAPPGVVVPPVTTPAAVVVPASASSSAMDHVGVVQQQTTASLAVGKTAASSSSSSSSPVMSASTGGPQLQAPVMKSMKKRIGLAGVGQAAVVRSSPRVSPVRPKISPQRTAAMVAAGSMQEPGTGTGTGSAPALVVAPILQHQGGAASTVGLSSSSSAVLTSEKPPAAAVEVPAPSGSGAATSSAMKTITPSDATVGNNKSSAAPETTNADSTSSGDPSFAKIVNPTTAATSLAKTTTTSASTTGEAQTAMTTAASTTATGTGTSAAASSSTGATGAKKAKKFQVIDGVEYIKTNVGLVPRSVYEQAWAAHGAGNKTAGTKKKRKREPDEADDKEGAKQIKGE
ncbi:unnamed protein product [Amoebophrya sp. A120]|nr:unnamed protein product [Amoebophrya sp. A120]|eukprot:GSA120T00012757001.1